MKEKDSPQNGKKHLQTKMSLRNKEDGVQRHDELSLGHNKQERMPWAASGNKVDMIISSEVRGTGRDISLRYHL